MEQDAIETLLFMSSPGNSGYHANAQQDRQRVLHVDTNGSTQSTAQQNSQQRSQGDLSQGSWAASNSDHRNGDPGSAVPNFECGAGDEIDRMLDQMDDSDSEYERRLALRHVRRN